LMTTRDPLPIHAVRVAVVDREQIESEVWSEVRAAYEQALEDPLPRLQDLQFPG
jgi:hypothetical protein